MKLLIPLLLLASPLLADGLDGVREGSPDQRKRLDGLEGAAAPKIDLKEWINSDPTTLKKLEGKIVVLDFWATWCGPCIASIPHNNEMAKKYEKDVVIIGVCHPRGAEKMEALAKSKGIEYPIAIDPKGKASETYKVNGYPDYYIIGRDGKLLVADCGNSKVEDALDTILKAEK